MTLAVLRADHGFVSLVVEARRFERRRRLDPAPLRQIARRYRNVCESSATGPSAEATLVTLGFELYRWLDGAEGWLGELRTELNGPFVFEVQGSHADEAALALLHAPWELLADEVRFLAADELLRFAPVRRIGTPVQRETGPYRLGVAFMASAPRGADELDFEAEEAAILAAAPQDVDLFVEDSGDPKQLGRRLVALEHGLQVLHLSCHGHDHWRAPSAEPQPVLLMEDQAGNKLPTSAADLVDALGAAKPQLLFLSACLTATAAPEATTATSLAAVLVGRAGLPAVLGWDGSVADVSATAFAREFYQRLANRWSIVEAAAAARRHLLQSDSMLRRDWHLARVWLGAAPPGGGAIVGGTGKRSLPRPNHGSKQVLAKKSHALLEVADPAVFVGRRRALQEALRALSDGEHAGVLLHGLGRLGKSSLAARIADRRPDLRLVVTFEAYDALSVLADLEEALKDHAPARELLAARRPAVRDDPDALYPLLVDLLAGPCADSSGKPLLLLVDDLERILEPVASDDVRRVRTAELPVMRALLRAFDPAHSDSRLVITSRFRFALVHDDVDLTKIIQPIQLTEFSLTARRKLLRRQVDIARVRPAVSESLSDAGIEKRYPLLSRVEELACGNPGLQDMIADKLILRRAVPVERAKAVLDQIAGYLSGGALPGDEAVRTFLQNLAVDGLLDEAGPTGNALLRAMTIFDVPVPSEVVDTLATIVSGSPGRLQALGLLDASEDIVQGKALVVGTLVAARLAPLTDVEKSQIAPPAAKALFCAWGGADGPAANFDRTSVVLTRLGLLANDAEVVASCAPGAIWTLMRGYSAEEAVDYGRRAITLLEYAGHSPSLLLLANVAEALEFTGDGEAEKEVLAKGVGQTGEANDGARYANISRFLFQLGQSQIRSGEPHEAWKTFEQLCIVERSRGNEHQFAVARGQMADILVDRGELDEALRIRREEQLPVFERQGDVRAIAVTKGRIADILRAWGELDEALRIRREEELPVYTRLGDVRAIAITQGKIADILIARGKLDEALRIRREEELPVYKQLGDVHSVAVTQGQIADILVDRGELDEALRIRREEQLPVYTRLRDVRAIAITQGNIASTLALAGDLDAAKQLNVTRLATNRTLNDADGIAATQLDLALIDLAQGDIESGFERLVESWNVFLKIGRAEGIAAVGAVLGQLLAANDATEAATQVLSLSIEAYHKLGRDTDARRLEQLLAELPPQ